MNIPEITYKTDAHVIVRDGMDTKNAAAVHWRKGPGEKIEISVGPASIKLTCNQLAQIAALVPAIATDVTNTAPGSALIASLGGVK